MRILPSLLLTASLAGALAVPAACGSPTQVQRDVPLGEAFWLEVGGLAVLQEGPTVIRFRVVESDSRCPTDALILCVDAGSARLEFSLATEVGDETVFSLDSHVSGGSAVTEVAGMRVELVEVAPPARLEPPLRPRDYRVRLVVTAAQE